ncbi:MAG: S9 family peptidase [Myxococcota bacterium]
MSAPVAKKVAHTHTEHGVERPDPWHWIKDRQDPDLMPLLEAENAYVEQMMGHTSDLRTALYDEMLGRIQEDDSSVPVRIDDWWYHTRTVEGQAYGIHARRHGALDADEQVLLDENKLAEGHDYFNLEQASVSPDHTKVAWLQDTAGAEHFVLLVRDLETGETTQVAKDLKWSITWAADSRHVFATRPDAAQRPFQAWRFDTTGEHAPALVHEEPDERFFVGVSHTRDHRYVLIEVGSKTTSEIHLVDSTQPTEPSRVVWPRRPGVLYDLVHHTGTFYVRTNDDGVNFRVVSVPATTPQDPPKVLVAHDLTVFQSQLQAFANHLVLWERRDGLPTVRIHDLRTGEDHLVSFPEAAYQVSPERNPVFNTHELRWTYTSPRTPPTVEVFDMEDHERAVLKVHPVIGHDPRQYEVERLHATASDGEQIPISLLRPSTLDPSNGPHPLFLIAYGSYGFSYPASFRSSRLSLADRGVVVAIAHIRGGADKGRTWYEDGKLDKKPNSFTDFIAAAEHLVSQGWTQPDKLAIQGGSAGGLLMGAVANLRPDLFAAVVADVPFVDALNTMLDDTLPLTVTEYEEWGNPNERAVFDTMLAYSPYDNVKKAAYPHLYITAGLNDPRVGYWEPAKWAQKLRENTTSDNPILLRTHLGAGHGGLSGRYGQLTDAAWMYAFVIDRLGVS